MCSVLGGHNEKFLSPSSSHIPFLDTLLVAQTTASHCNSLQWCNQEFVLDGAVLRLEGPKFEAIGRKRGRDSWGGAASPLSTS